MPEDISLKYDPSAELAPPRDQASADLYRTMAEQGRTALANLALRELAIKEVLEHVCRSYHWTQVMASIAASALANREKLQEGMEAWNVASNAGATLTREQAAKLLAGVLGPLMLEAGAAALDRVAQQRTEASCELAEAHAHGWDEKQRIASSN